MESLYPVSKLKERYQIGKQAEINRRKHLKIKPLKKDGTNYITKEELDLLDSLDQYLKETGGKMSDFSPKSTGLAVESSGGHTGLDSVDSTEVEYQEAKLIENNPDDQNLDNNWNLLIETLAKNLQPARSPLQHWRELEEASEKGWLLTTSQVKELAGAKPKGEKWQRGSFLFTKASKIGSQTAWLVEKI